MVFMMFIYPVVGGDESIRICLIMSVSQIVYIIININETYQNSWLIILNQDYNIWHMFINRNTAFTAV